MTPDITTIKGDYSGETVIIGGSLAGAALALKLLQAGRAVCMIDREHFPRSKSCGEGLSGAGQVELIRLGVPLGDLSYTTLDGYEILFNDNRLHLPSLPISGVSHLPSIGVRRRALDTVILCQLQKFPNFRFFEGERIERVTSHLGQFVTETQNGSFRSSFLVGADGANSKVGELFGDTPQPKKIRYALSLWFDIPTSLNTVLISLRDGYQLFFTKLSASELNCSILSDHPEPISRDRKQTLKVIANVAKEQLALTLPSPREVRGTTVQPGIRRRSSVPNLLYVGDAAEVFDPIGGMGMTHALMSARHAAHCIISSTPHGDNSSAFRRYEDDRNRDAREFRAVTRLVSLTLKDLPYPLSRVALHSANTLLHLPEGVQRSTIQLLSNLAGR